MRKPSLFIIGAPKCGTTSLSRYLGSHERIYISDPKEPFYFNTDLQYRGVVSEKDYLKLFMKTQDSVEILGEASTSYLYSKEAVPNIIKFNPDAKFIVMVRNPVDMAYSLHKELLWIGIEHVESFEEAWFLQRTRRAGKGISWYCRDPAWLQYREVCALGSQLKRLFATVGREKVHVIVFDDFVSDTRQEYLRVLSFLGVPDDGRVVFDAHNRGKRHKFKFVARVALGLRRLKEKVGLRHSFGVASKMMEWNTVTEGREYNSEFREYLCMVFADEIELLEHILCRDLSRWRRGDT
ncbi:sulfotransferase family protein [Deferrisoma camini]|uniref:sulfotransferase family protein n=1 Tax=Deferrisoma camini TaxID=1035120 RepID=UPI000A04C77B|nr:sulfotransferase [Deferrisoma camini]